MSTDASTRHSRLAAIPHMQASEKRAVNVPAQNGIIAHVKHLVDTACGQEMPTTLVTRDAARVRCPDCRKALGNQEEQGR